MFDSLLSLLIVTPLIGSVHLLFSNGRNETIKTTGLVYSLIVFVMSTLLWVHFDETTPTFQFVENYEWLSSININLVLGIDGISLFFVLLTTLLIPLCLLGRWAGIQTNVKEYFMAFLIMEAMLIAVFSILDLILFYVFFESVLIPMFLIIGFWGSRENKIRAAYLFFLYTLFGSVLMLLAILYLYFETGTSDYQLLYEVSSQLNPDIQKLLWLAFFASFAAKFPLIPLHIWLPQAHVEAPTAGSVILAGVLLKLGSYGLLRFSMPLFPVATFYFVPLAFTMGSIGVIYAALTAIRQTDIKRVIAYARVSHMGVVLIGMFSLNAQGVEGRILQMLSHGLVSGALFLCVGVLYDRHHSRLIKYYSGVAHIMPVFVAIFMFFTIANIALPGTSSFVGEFLILAGAFQANPAVCFLGATGMVLGGCYSLWLFNRISFGNLKTQYIHEFQELNRREFWTFFPLIVLTLVMGLYPRLFLEPMHASVAAWLEHIYLGANIH
jgi:proton-translocating NADH-quinone oxidoreductase chain M